jgi:hypothetical protein
MINSNWSFICLCSLILCGCASINPKVRVLPEYEDLQLSADRLTVAPFSVWFLNLELAAKDFETLDFKNLYDRHFAEQFPLALIRFSRIKSVYLASKPPDAPLRTRSLQLTPTDTVFVPLPDDSTIVRFDSLGSDYIIFLSTVKTEDREGGGVIPEALPGKESVGFAYHFAEVLHKADFALWDNTKGRLVAFGHVAGGAQYSRLVRTQETWKRSIYSFGEEIRNATPFRIQ